MSGYLRFFRREAPLLSYGVSFTFFSSFCQTFQRRGTPIPVEEPAGLSDAFASDPERCQNRC